MDEIKGNESGPKQVMFEQPIAPYIDENLQFDDYLKLLISEDTRIAKSEGEPAPKPEATAQKSIKSLVSSVVGTFFLQAEASQSSLPSDQNLEVLGRPENLVTIPKLEEDLEQRKKLKAMVERMKIKIDSEQMVAKEGKVKQTGGKRDKEQMAKYYYDLRHCNYISPL